MNQENTYEVQSLLQGFSPFTRKFLALGILFLGLFFFWTVIASPVVSQMSASLTELNDTRFQRMRLEQIQNRPAVEPTGNFPTNLVLAAGSAEEAQAAFAAQINAVASQNTMDMALAPRPLTKGSQLIAFDVSVMAPEVNIVKFINSLERASPMMRLRNWQIDSAAIAGTVDPQNGNTDESNGNVQFSGQLIGAWIRS
ncbi:MAG: hypothetical protein ABJN65_01180 [Parasphingorhabdus sp.]